MISISRVLTLVICVLLAAPAWAGPRDARDQGALAQDLLTAVELAQANAAAAYNRPAPEFDPELATQLQRFGYLAFRLATEIDQSGGPADLACIHRGMAEETDVQLGAISDAKTGSDQAQAFDRLISMLDDAVMVSEATARALKDPDPANARSPAIGTCPASAY